MKIVLTSDLHRGFDEETSKILHSFFMKIKEEKPDVIVLAGDLGSNKFDHFRGCLKHIREVITDVPIIAVRGNHDLWDKHTQNISHLLFRGSKAFKDNNIHHLELGSFIKDNVFFCGWDGWYAEIPRTNDKYHIPGGELTHNFLTRRAHLNFERVLTELENAPKDCVKIVVTHMPCFDNIAVDHHYNANPKYIEFLKGKCNFLLYGHTHRAYLSEVEGITVINSGSDYNNPKYVTIEG